MLIRKGGGSGHLKRDPLSNKTILSSDVLVAMVGESACVLAIAILYLSGYSTCHFRLGIVSGLVMKSPNASISLAPLDRMQQSAILVSRH